jgi:hypothetical protein
MNSSVQTESKRVPPSNDAVVSSDSTVVLVREAGVPYQQLGVSADPFAEWINLMEVVQILCPNWPQRARTIMGKQWKL